MKLCPALFTWISSVHCGSCLQIPLTALSQSLPSEPLRLALQLSVVRIMHNDVREILKTSEQ